jgi:hypothetical protein
LNVMRVLKDIFQALKEASFWTGRVTQVVECLLSKCEALSSNPSTSKVKGNFLFTSVCPGKLSIIIEGEIQHSTINKDWLINDHQNSTTKHT